MTKSGWTQKYYKDEEGWKQATDGVARHMTAEQFLSHLLPALANPRITVRVEKKK